MNHKTNYLIEHRNEIVLEYPSINQSVTDFFKHLFFTNGNGIYFENGCIMEDLPYNRKMKLLNKYTESIPFSEMKEYYKEYKLELRVEEAYVQKKAFNNTMKRVLPEKAKTEDELWEETYKKYYSKIYNLEELTEEELFSEDFWYSAFVSSTNEIYFPHLRLSDGFFDLQKVNSLSDDILLKTAIAFSTGLLRTLELINSGELKPEDFKPILSIKWTDEYKERCLKTAKSDYKMIAKELKRLSEIVEIRSII